jgi:hypothetical protein
LSTSTIPPTALNHTSVTTRLLVLCPNDVIKGFRLETGIREGHLPHNLHKSEAQNHNAASIPNQKKFGSVFQPNRVGFNHSNQSPNAHSHLPQALVFTSNSSFLSFFWKETMDKKTVELRKTGGRRCRVIPNSDSSFRDGDLFRNKPQNTNPTPFGTHQDRFPKQGLLTQRS